MRIRWSLLMVALAMVAGACGGGDGLFVDPSAPSVAGPDGTLDPTAPGVTGTVPIPGPADWLEWPVSAAPGPDVEDELVAALVELDMVMITPSSPPPGGAEAFAVFHSMSLGWGSGATFPGTTTISLEVRSDRETLVLIRSSGGITSCPPGASRFPFRDDPEACRTDDRSVTWREAGHSLDALVRGGMTPAAGLAWIETWRLLP